MALSATPPLDLDDLYRLWGAVPPPATSISAEEMPEPYRSLLAHEGHMTVTLERFHRTLVRLEVLDIQDLPEGYLVRFAAENEGSQAAAALLIEGELELPDGQTETGEATIDYLPPRSTREGALVFRNDPVSGDLTVRPKGFTRP